MSFSTYYIGKFVLQIHTDPSKCNLANGLSNDTRDAIQ